MDFNRKTSNIGLSHEYFISCLQVNMEDFKSCMKRQSDYLDKEKR